MPKPERPLEPMLGPAPKDAGAIRRKKSLAGQSVFIALAVMFLLAFLAALFITLLARNLQGATRSTQTLNADYYAQAGINYANTMLQTSPQGADWRPPLQDNLTVQTTGATGAYKQGFNGQQSTIFAAAVTNLGLPPIAQADPDLPWLLDGFTRYNVGQGRFLIRLTYVYDPDNTTFPANSTAAPSTTQKYILIESIGRYGNVDPTDPTTFVNQPPTHLRTEMVAYKPIGLTDYARFITNKDDRDETANLGVPGVNTAAAGSPYANPYQTVPTSGASPFNTYFTSNPITIVTPGTLDFDPSKAPFSSGNLPWVRPYPIITTYGQSDGYAGFTGSSSQFGGGSLRANCNLRLYGVNMAYLNPSLGDDWEVAGSIIFDRYNPANTLAQQQAQLDVFNPVVSTTAPTPMYPSNGVVTGIPSFTTDQGVVRDGNASSDAQGYPRDIQRLDPPSLDTTDPASNLTRYRELTKLSAVVTGGAIGAGGTINPGGPATIYINNTADIQNESRNVQPGYTLRDEWLNRGQNPSNWTGDFYSPPGVVIHFGPIPNPAPNSTGPFIPYLMLSNGDPAWGMTITRSDKDSNGNAIYWPNNDGSASTSQTMYLVYAPLSQLNTATTPVPTPSTYFFAGANNAPGATGVTNPQNDIVVFAEGNVRVSGMISDPGSGNTSYQHVTIVTNGIGYVDSSILKGGPGYSAPSYVSESSLAMLAESYICVNTTQFLAGPPNFNLSTDPTPSGSSTPPFTLDFADASKMLTEPLVYLPAVDASGATNPSPPALYISQFTSQGGNQQGQATLMDQTGVFETSIGSSTGLLPTIGTGYGGSAGTWANQWTVPLSSGFTGTSTGFPAALENYQLTFSMPASYNGWELENAAVLPSDARIEAILYAQDNSFFVIPGSWFNSNPSDNITNLPTADSFRSDTDAAFQRFPFYGQPIDLQISIVGSVTENLPADLGDQTQWMQKWGWIPIYHGGLYPGNTANYTGGTPATGTAETSPVRDVNSSATVPQVGLNFTYDPANGFDLVNESSTLTYVRLDQFGRPLPLAPDLPVSTDLFYSGQSNGASLVP